MSSTSEEIAEKVGKKITGSISNVFESNKSIISNLFGGAELVENLLENEGKNLGDSLKIAAEKTFKEGEKLNYGKIAGSYIGASAAYRLASGGGLLKDKNGNTDIIGIPFV